ncbi:MAG: serine hydrolase [Phycisphaerales bacterium]
MREARNRVSLVGHRSTAALGRPENQHVRLALLTIGLALAPLPIAAAQPYDFGDADALLTAELPNLSGRVAVIVRQNGRELYRFQRGTINYATRTHLASFTKTLSAAVVLSVVDDGRLGLHERIGDVLPAFASNGIGAPTVLDCFGMRHGIHTPIAYEIDRRYTLAQSVALIGATGFQAYPPGTTLDYDGPGMQVVGRICELRGLRSWSTLARDRIFLPCAMPNSDYLEFDPNPAIAGGARSSADETMNFAQMVIDGGVFNGAQVLSLASIERLFTNSTLGLPIGNIPFPASHPEYPYGEQPDYGFGDWILAQNPASGHVEEVVGAGAWGSFIWFDRRRALTAVLITDIPAGSQASVDAALGLFSIARRETELAQAKDLTTAKSGLGAVVSWTPAPGSTHTRIYGSLEPIRDIFDLRRADLSASSTGGSVTAAPYPYFAALALFEAFENTALIPGENSLDAPAPCPADVTRDGVVDGDDVIAFFDSWDRNDPAADLNLDAGVDGDDVIGFFGSWDAGC